MDLIGPNGPIYQRIGQFYWVFYRPEQLDTYVLAYRIASGVSIQNMYELFYSVYMFGASYYRMPILLTLCANLISLSVSQ